VVQAAQRVEAIARCYPCAAQGLETAGQGISAKRALRVQGSPNGDERHRTRRSGSSLVGLNAYANLGIGFTRG
jgi:hypothetical protein